MKFFIAVGVILVVIGVGVWYYLDTMNSPQGNVLSQTQKTQALTKLLDRAPILEVKKPAGWKTFNGKYVQFAYPSDANVYVPHQQPAVIQESFSCGLLDPRILISVQVAEPSDMNSLDDYPAVSVRKTQNDVYHGSTATVASHQGVSFTKQNEEGVERSGFFLVNGKVYSFVVSGYDLSNVQDYYNRLIGSVSF